MVLTRFGFDVLSAVILSATAAAGAYAPVVLSRRDKLAGGTGRSFAYVIGNMFSAGVMVSAGFCHLLGEALKQMPRFQFPLAPFLCGCGYLLTLCADKAAAMLAGAGGEVAAGVEVIAGLDLAERGTPSHALRHGWPDEEAGPLLRSGSGGHVATGGGASTLSSGAKAASSRHVRSSSASDEGLQPPAEERRNGGPGLAAAHSSRGSAFGSHFELELTQAAQDSGVALRPKQPESRACPGGSGGRLAPPPPPTRPGAARPVSFLTAVLMGVALCFHSLLEGAAMGAQSTISNSLHIFIAIVSHKGLAAYALGSSIVESQADMSRFWSVILPFTFASPIGIFIGYVIADVAQGVGAASISALASGTFLYVAFMEVIPREMHDPHWAGAKLGALLLGFCLMSILAIWA